MAQFARPDGDVTNTGTNGFGAIDESSASDADFWFGDNNVAEELEVSLSNVTDPNSSSGHIVRFRIGKTNAGVLDGGGNAVTVTCRLMQGTTQIATSGAITATGTWTTSSFTLSSAEADAITNYNDLRLEFVTSSSGGSPANRRGGAVSWAELEVPNVVTNVNGTATVSGGGAVTASGTKGAASSPTISGGGAIVASGGELADSVFFDGVDDALSFNLGNAAIPAGPITLAIVMKDNAWSEGNFDALLVAENGVDDRWWTAYMYGFGSNVFMLGTTAGDQTGPAAVDLGTLGLTGQWVILVVTKADGTVAPRFHRFDETNGWDHQDAAGTLANGTTPPSDAKLRVGHDTLFGSPADVNMLIFGIKDAVMSDAEIEALADGHQAWVDAGFVEGIRLDAVSGLTSFAGGGIMALEAASGAVVDAGDGPTWWNDELAPAVEGTASISGGGAVTAEGWSVETTPILSTLDGADENPLSEGGNFTGPFLAGRGQLQRLSNVAAPVANTSQSYWTQDDFLETEVYFTVAAKPGTSGAWITLVGRLANPASAERDDYELEITANSGGAEAWNFWRHQANTGVNVATLTATEVNVGDMILFQIRGSGATVKLLAWHKPSGGVWTLIGTFDDSSADRVVAEGKLAMEISTSAAWRLDDFGGGEIGGGGANDVDGTAAVSGGGTVSASGQKDTSAVATVSGGGAVSATGQKSAADVAAIAGGGTVTASGAEGAARAATLSGGGAITASGAKDAPAAATVSGGGALAGTETTDRSVAPVLSGGGTLSGVAEKSSSGTTILSGGGSVVVVSGKTFSIDVAVSGGGALSASASKNANASTVISGGGSLSATGQAASEGEGSATLSGGGTLSATGQKDSSSSPSLSGGGAIATVTSKGGLATPTISGGGSPTATTSRGADGAAVLSGGGVGSGAGAKGAAGTPLVSGGGSQTATAGKDAFVSAILTGGGELVATGVPAFGTTGTLVISGGGVVAALGASERLSIASLSGGGSPSFSTAGAHASVVVLSGGGELTASGVEGEAPAVAQIDETSTSGLKGVTRTA